MNQRILLRRKTLFRQCLKLYIHIGKKPLWVVPYWQKADILCRSADLPYVDRIRSFGQSKVGFDREICGVKVLMLKDEKPVALRVTSKINIKLKYSLRILVIVLNSIVGNWWQAHCSRTWKFVLWYFISFFCSILPEAWIHLNFFVCKSLGK